MVWRSRTRNPLELAQSESLECERAEAGVDRVQHCQQFRLDRSCSHLRRNSPLACALTVFSKSQGKEINMTTHFGHAAVVLALLAGTSAASAQQWVRQPERVIVQRPGVVVADVTP